METVIVNATGTDDKHLNVPQSIGVAETQPAMAPPEVLPPGTENKEQLHLRVEARLHELGLALAEAGGPTSTSERGRALVAALDIAQGSISCGWDKVGEMEAAQLAQWLAKTEDLKMTAQAPVLAKA